MKFFPQLLLFSIIFISSQAQEFKKLPSFGDVSKAELEMKECSFDKDAPAMVIFEEAESVFRLNLEAINVPFFEQTEFRFRIKIFNQSGFDQANIKLRYPTSNKEVNIIKLSAQTYNLDASGNIVVTKVDKANVYDKKINSRYSEKIFAFPEVKAGSIIEYKYILDNSSQDEWYFQRSIPVQFSRFIINFPPELIVASVPYCSLPLLRGKSDRKGAGNYSWYAMENVPGLADEPYMSCREDYLQKLETQLTAIDLPNIPRRSLLRTWPEIIKELVEDEDFGKQLKKDIPRTSELDNMLRGVNDPYKKMVIIHEYVRTNMEWNGYSNIWALEGIKSAWKDKKGTTGEINLILVNLLKDAGLTVNPLLVSTRNNGIVNTGVAGYNQFDKVLAQVTIDSHTYILDATERVTPSSLIPLEVMASEGLLIAKPDKYEWGWRTLFDEKDIFSRQVILNAEVDTNGTLKGFAKITSGGYERCRLLPSRQNSVVKLKDNLTSLQTIKIDSLNFENELIDSLPLIEQVGFENAGSSSGAYKYFSLNLFSGFEKNPFIAEERMSDIFYGANQKYDINAAIFIPEGYSMEGLPKNIQMRMPDTSIVFTRQSAFNSGILTVFYRVEFKSPFFSKEVYPEFREFYKKLVELLNEQFVFKKS